jgi:hypothetical protein
MPAAEKFQPGTAEGGHRITAKLRQTHDRRVRMFLRHVAEVHLAFKALTLASLRSRDV